MASSSSHVATWMRNLAEERDGIALYEGLAEIDVDRQRAGVFRELAAGERRHAGIWETKLIGAGAAAPLPSVSLRVRLLLRIARSFGVRAALPWVMSAERKDIAKYSQQGRESAGLAAEEREHLERLRSLTSGPGAEASPSGHRPPPERDVIVARERWHRGGRAGSVRAAVFGINDGLVSNVSLVLGVAAAGASHETLVITGLAGLMAGAFSMAAGEFISVASQRDLLKRQIDLEARELAEAPAEEEAELAGLFAQKGFSSEQAAQAARGVMKDPAVALDTLVREELGLDPADLGSPAGAAGASFVMFAIGAAIPIAPFLLTSGHAATTASAVLSAAVLAGVGGLLGILSGTGWLRSAARMVGLAALAAGATIGIGLLVGVGVS